MPQRPRKVRWPLRISDQDCLQAVCRSTDQQCLLNIHHRKFRIYTLFVISFELTVNLCRYVIAQHCSLLLGLFSEAVHVCDWILIVICVLHVSDIVSAWFQWHLQSTGSTYHQTRSWMCQHVDSITSTANWTTVGYSCSKLLTFVSCCDRAVIVLCCLVITMLLCHCLSISMWYFYITYKNAATWFIKLSYVECSTSFWSIDRHIQRW